MGAPYYGAYFAAMALADADRIAPLDTQHTPYAAYAIYKHDDPVKVLLYNSKYYTPGNGHGGRPLQEYTLSGIRADSRSVEAKRLTAPFATSRVDRGENPSIAGRTFANGTCEVKGEEMLEMTDVEDGMARFTVAASEALLVYLK